MSCVSVTISYSFRCLTTETVKYTSFIEKLAASKYSYVGTERETNVIINNNVHFAFSEEELPCVQNDLYIHYIVKSIGTPFFRTENALPNLWQEHNSCI